MTRLERGPVVSRSKGVRFPYEALYGEAKARNGASKTPKESSILSPCHGLIVQEEDAGFASQRSGCDSRSVHHGALAQMGERLDGIQKAAGSIPASSTVTIMGS